MNALIYLDNIYVYAGDGHGQWQALEGLGAVAFHQGQMNKAIKYFKLALSTMSSTEQNPAAQERIVGRSSHNRHQNMSQGP